MVRVQRTSVCHNPLSMWVDPNVVEFGLGELQEDEDVMNESREIRLPAEICAKAEEKFGGTFRSLDELLTFVLQELLRTDTLELDQADQKVVEDRLRDLGYI